MPQSLEEFHAGFFPETGPSRALILMSLNIQQEEIGLLLLDMDNQYLLQFRELAEQVGLLVKGVQLFADLRRKSNELEYSRGVAETQAHELQKTADSLLKANEHLSVTLQSIIDGVITTDNQGRILMMNPIAEELTGWKCKESRGRRLDEVLNLTCEDGTAREEIFEKAFQCEPKRFLVQFARMTSRDGGTRSIALKGAPIRNTARQSHGVVIVFQDLTEKQRMENELLKAKQLESIGILAGGIAHDFNNILTVILGNLSHARTHVKSPEMVNDTLIAAEKATMRAKDLSHQLLTFSKGGAPIKKTTCIADILRDTVGFTLRGSTIACEYSIASELWNVDVDAGQMSQVISNFVINAIQAMANGGIITIHAENLGAIPNPQNKLEVLAGKYIKVSIRDQGVGIAEANIQKIFDPFYTTKPKGNGLGLTVSNSIIKNHGGWIEVTSELGKGTAFAIYLPASEKKVFRRQLRTKPRMTGKGRILIMDDEDEIRAIVSRSLKLSGFDVTEAVNGEQALELYRDANDRGLPFEVVIMDLTIPGGMGGAETLKHLRSLNPKVKAIVSSGYSDDPVMANYHRHGFCGVVCKPYELETLKQTICEVLLH